MKVWEFRNILADEHDYALIDNETCEEIIEETNTDLYDDCEVLEIRGQTCDTIALYINRPTEKYETWLDVTYSARVELEVPYGCKDVTTYFRNAGQNILEKLPASFEVNGIKLVIDYDNTESGSYYDMIERC